MKIILFCVLGLLSLSAAYLIFNASGGEAFQQERQESQQVSSVAPEENSVLSVVANEENPQKPLHEDTTSLTTVVYSQEQNEYLKKINNMFDELQEQIDYLYEPVDIDTLDYEDCNHLSGRALSQYMNSDLFEVQGAYMFWSGGNYEDYWHFETDFLRQLAEADDFAAQQMLPVILMNSVDTLEEGLQWAKIAIARDSTASIKYAQMAYRQMFSKTHETNFHLKVSEIELQIEVFEALSQYRDGNPVFRREDKEQYQNDPVAQEYFTLLDEILGLRESYGLPQFVNRPQPGPPEKIRQKCKDLFLEQVRQINPAAFQDN